MKLAISESEMENCLSQVLFPNVRTHTHTCITTTHSKEIIYCCCTQAKFQFHIWM